MDIDNINKKLSQLKENKSIEDAHALACELVKILGIDTCSPEKLLIHSSIQREIARFVPAQGFRNQASAYEVEHQNNIPLDIKLFWMKKITKANLSWLVALTPNLEDNSETNSNMNLGIDFVISENCESFYIIVSNNLKLRVLELNGPLSVTQQEILDNWSKIVKGLNQESDTYKKQLHDHLWKSFDFEPLNKQFYQELVKIFDNLTLHLKGRDIDVEHAKMFAVRLIGRTLFLWFLRKKDFLNSEKEYFQVAGSDDQTEYYRSKLEPLFFEVLNTEIKNRNYDDSMTPFLNGGLFEAVETDYYNDSKLTFPDGFFSQFYGLLNRYNFTVDEGTSEYQQVAVDPEMLGRVFENLLASINPETGKNARKAKGAFYTPREIVDYMCEQSLTEYLKTKLPDTQNRDRRIQELVSMDEASFREQDHNKRRDWKKDLGQKNVLDALDELRVLDPAVGSGAFPIGMLSLLVKVYSRIDTSREKDLAMLKRDILSHSLYGVDIDQMAIQISRLRAWLSILVDVKNITKVKPLPNLDFKFVCANTLIPLETEAGLFDIVSKDELIDIRNQYYKATTKIDKKKLQKEYLLNLQLSGGLFESKKEEQLKDYDPFDSLNSSDFYDSDLMHGVASFNVIIGNPPYKILTQNNTEEKLLSSYKQGYRSIRNAQSKNIYTVFIEKATMMASESGITCLIVPEGLFSTRSYRDCVKFLRDKGGLKFITTFTQMVFENATTGNLIFLHKKGVTTKTEYYHYNVEKKLEKVEIITDSIISKIKEKCFTTFGDELFIFKGMVVKNRETVISEDPIGKNDIFLLGKSIKKWIITKPFYTNYLDLTIIGGTKVLEKYNIYPRILLRRTGDSLCAALIDKPSLSESTLYSLSINASSKYDLFVYFALINSKLYTYLIQSEMITNKQAFPQILMSDIKEMPILSISMEDQKNLIRLVEKILNTKSNRSDLDISATKIDEIVMDLYELNEEEKDIIRNN